MTGTFHRYFLQQFQTNPALGNPLVERSDYLSSSRRAILDVASRLDALPQHDPFWREVESQPSCAWMGLFTDYLRRQNPCDELALWGQIALGQLYGSGYLNAEEWRQFQSCGLLEVRDLVHSGWHIAASLGDFASYRSCLSRDLVRLLEGLGLTEAAKPVLETLPEEVQSLAITLVRPLAAQDWARRVLHGMRTPSLWDGVQQIDGCYDHFSELIQPLVPLQERVEDEVAFAAARLGYSTINPGERWGSCQQAKYEAFLERVIRPVSGFVFEEEQWTAVVFGSLGIGSLLAMTDAGRLGDLALKLSEEYLESCLVSYTWLLASQLPT